MRTVDEEMMVRVRRAAAYLDAKFGKGEWEERINLAELDQGNGDHCVGGQLGEADQFGTPAWRQFAEEFSEITGDSADVHAGPFGCYSQGEWVTVLKERGYEVPESPIIVGDGNTIMFGSMTRFDLVGDVLTIFDTQDTVKIDLGKLRTRVAS